jgi:transposase
MTARHRSAKIEVLSSVNLKTRGEVMNEITTVGVDLAKEVIAVCAADRCGRVVLQREYRRDSFAAWAVRLPNCVFGMEACGAAHHWARWLTSHGHSARLMAPEFVQPFRKSRGAKNDRNDAEAVLTAVRQPNMRFVTTKTVEQQACLSWHRLRQGWIEERTALINRLRGLLGEFGVWRGRSAAKLIGALPVLEHDEALPLRVRRMISEGRAHLQRLEQSIAGCDKEIKSHIKDHPVAEQLAQISGVGPLTIAAVLAMVSNAADFNNGRAFAAWQGVVPRQHSSGGKARLGRITKQGDSYLRGLLTQGARSALQAAINTAPDRLTRLQRWMVQLNARVGYHKTLVAIANKHARIIWAMLAKGEAYDPEAWQRRARTAPVSATQTT